MKKCFIACAVLYFLTGCSWQLDSRPSFVVVMVEGLSFDSVSCVNESWAGGFQTLCQDGVRFTHAYTPSTMTQAVAASLVTGEYPISHHVRDNGADYLHADAVTVAEIAVQRGYRTSFVSGGPPIFRKSGLSQGFEFFEDNFELGVGKYYRPSRDVFRIFTNWLDKDVGGSPFMSFLFLADLQFPEVSTTDPEGRARERSRKGQLAELDHSLGKLFDGLKMRHRWDSTNLIVLGTNGIGLPMDLRSENTQVALFIKPANKPRDKGSHWTIDRNVTLVDVGKTLFREFGERPAQGPLSVVSLESVFQKPAPDWSPDRLIMTESGWTKWRLGASIRYALRQNQLLFINDKKPLIFNSFTDWQENMPLKSDDPLWLSLNKDILAKADELGIPPFFIDNQGLLKRAEVGRKLWGRSRPDSDAPWKVVQIRPQPLSSDDRPTDDARVVEWDARFALRDKDWSKLEQLGRESGRNIWTYVAMRNSDRRPHVILKGCGKIFRTGAITEDCRDDNLVALLQWMHASPEDRIWKEERFLRAYSSNWIMDRIGQLNYQNGLKWDVRPQEPGGPTLSDLYLSMKGNGSYRRIVHHQVISKDGSL